MRFERVRIAALGWDRAPLEVSSLALERRLGPLYERLSLREGRLELMSGVRARRFYPSGERPSAIAARAGAHALARAEIDRARIGLLLHTSVCRDMLEPASAAFVHRALELAPECPFLDLSNACLGFANGLALAAAQIERGEIDAALIVAGEDGGPLVEATLERLLAETANPRKALKLAFASLTIGAGGAAAVLCRDELAPRAPRLLGGVARSASQHSALCQGDREAELAGPLMETEAEALMHAGIELARETFPRFLAELGWTAGSIERIATHQVGSAQRRLLFDALGLDAARDYPTLAEYGNVGSVSLPLSLALALESGFIGRDQRVALLGIGSGLGCLMLGVQT
ncbi:MAG: 3-oxoacyl-ACP synthase III [Planctomycetota bacterium]|nr:MAG: 3-oxoacyl-ACP synthase III [Planctomycetota bacterium]